LRSHSANRKLATTSVPSYRTIGKLGDGRMPWTIWALADTGQSEIGPTTAFEEVRQDYSRDVPVPSLTGRPVYTPLWAYGRHNWPIVMPARS
jgi:hypothetical protein